MQMFWQTGNPFIHRATTEWYKPRTGENCTGPLISFVIHIYHHIRVTDKWNLSLTLLIPAVKKIYIYIYIYGWHSAPAVLYLVKVCQSADVFLTGCPQPKPTTPSSVQPTRSPCCSNNTEP